MDDDDDGDNVFDTIDRDISAPDNDGDGIPDHLDPDDDGTLDYLDREPTVAYVVPQQTTNTQTTTDEVGLRDKLEVTQPLAVSESRRLPWHL